MGRLQRAVRLLKQASDFGSARDRRAWLTTHRIADDATPKFVNTLLLNVRDTKNQINVANLSQQVASGNVTGIQRALLRPGLNDDLRRLYRSQIQGVLNEAGVASVKLQPKVLAASFGRFDLTNPRAVEWARQKAATLVVAIEESTVQTIRTVIADGIQNGVPVRTTARKLRQSIGLTSRQWQSVNNFEDKLIKAGASRAAAEKGAERFSKVVLRRRAENIARTETIAAGIQGRFELWDQATDRGLIDGNEVKRKWIVTPDDRLDSAICLPMSGQVRGMKEPFLTGLGALVVGPPAHPQCRCDVILVIPGTSVFDDPPERRSASRERSIVTPQVSTPATAITTASTTVTPRAPTTALGRRLRRRPPGEELVVPQLPPPITVRPARPVNPTPEEVFTRHPQLEAIRGRINIEDFSDPRVREVVDDFARVSPKVLKRMNEQEANFQVSATRSVPDMIGLPDLNRRRPRGWRSGTWKNVKGGFFREKNTAIVNAAGTRGVSQSVPLHEYGHAIGRNLTEVGTPKGAPFVSMDAAESARAANGRAFDKLPQYFRQGGRGGRVGTQEMFAESTAFYYKPPPGLTGKQAVERFVDKDFATWLDKQLR